MSSLVSFTGVLSVAWAAAPPNLVDGWLVFLSNGAFRSVSHEASSRDDRPWQYARPVAHGLGGPEGMHTHDAAARVRHGERRKWHRTRATDARPSAATGHDGVGERRGCGACRGLLPLEGERVSPRGGGSLGRDGSAPSGPGRCLGGVGERQLDRHAAKETSRDRPNAPLREYSNFSATRPRTRVTGRESFP
jgi:hypothetical protein